MKKSLKQNVLFLQIHLIFAKRYTTPIQIIFFQSFGLNYSQIGILIAATSFADAIFTIYGGAFSDKHGRKLTSIVYSILGMLAMLTYATNSNFAGFLVASLLLGLSMAFGAGNASALLFDTLKCLNLEQLFKKYRGRMTFPAKIFGAFLIPVLPLIYLQNIRFPFFLGSVFYFLALFIALKYFIEPPIKEFKNTNIRSSISSSIEEILKNRKLIYIILIQVVIFGFSVLIYRYHQPLLGLANVPIAWFGVIYSIISLIEGFTSFIFHKFEKHRNIHMFLGCFLIILFALIGISLIEGYWLLFFILILAITEGICSVLFSDAINSRISSKNRTTIISISFFIRSIFVSLLVIFSGYLADLLGLQKMFLWASVAFVMFSALIYFKYHYKTTINALVRT